MWASLQRRVMVVVVVVVVLISVIKDIIKKTCIFNHALSIMRDHSVDISTHQLHAHPRIYPLPTPNINTINTTSISATTTPHTRRVTKHPCKKSPFHFTAAGEGVINTPPPSSTNPIYPYHLKITLRFHLALVYCHPQFSLLLPPPPPSSNSSNDILSSNSKKKEREREKKGKEKRNSEKKRAPVFRGQSSPSRRNRARGVRSSCCQSPIIQSPQTVVLFSVECYD